ncbi:TPA: hypothetical protein ACH3X1_004888 [Trebouxia sp. C0004]
MATYRVGMKRKATEDVAPQRPKRVVRSLAEKAQLQRTREAAYRRAASVPVRLAVAEARAGRQASQVQAKHIEVAKQAAKLHRESAKVVDRACKQAVAQQRRAAVQADRELTRAAKQFAAAITKAAKAIPRQQKRRIKHPMLNIARQGVHFQAHHVRGPNTNKDHMHQLDRMKEVCPYCKALMWLGERVSA